MTLNETLNEIVSDVRQIYKRLEDIELTGFQTNTGITPSPNNSGEMLIANATPAWSLLTHPVVANYHLHTTAAGASWLNNLSMNNAATAGDTNARIRFNTAAPQLVIEMNTVADFEFNPNELVALVGSEITLQDDSPLNFGTGKDSVGQYVSANNRTEWTGVDWFFDDLVVNIGTAIGGGGELLSVREDQNANTGIELVNTDANALASANFRVKNVAGAGGNDSLNFGITGTGWAAVGVLDTADTGIVQSGANVSGGLLLRASSNTQIVLAVNTDSEVLRGTLAEVVINDDSKDQDFRVESNTLTHALFVDGGGGLVGINETANANMTIGLTIDQGANDDEILNMRSSVVGAVLSTVVETGTYLTVSKVQGSSGGAYIKGFKDTDGANAIALLLQGYLAEDASITKTTAGRGIVEIIGNQTDGSVVENTVANGNVVVMRTQRGGSNVTIAIIDEDADMDLPSGRIATGFGDYWDLEDYHAGAPTADGYVRVDINGTTYQLLANIP